ncbi:MAG: hypothetical protein GXP62_07030 [Oligoflexia bacterium]|nr:hypothetical protein [Oligoflexia bacterium]
MRLLPTTLARQLTRPFAPLVLLPAVLGLCACGGQGSGDDTGSTATTGPTGTTGTTGTTTSTPWHLDLDPNCSPFAMADDCLTPWPNLTTMVDDSTSETGLRLNYSLEMFHSPDGELPVDPAIFNGFDGVSPISPVLINLGRDVDDALLHGPGDEEASLASDSAMALVRVSDGSRVPLLVEMDQSNRDLDYDGRWALILRPVAPLEPGERYVVALTTDLVDTDGAPFTSPDAFVALRDGLTTDDDRVEGMRDRYEQVLFPALSTAGLSRQDLLVAWEYQVASREQILGPITGMRDQALATIAKTGMDYTVDDIITDPNDDVSLVVTGTFAPPSFLSDQELVYSDDNYSAIQQKVRASYDYTMVIPSGLSADQSVPLVVIGHGIFGSGRDYIYSGSPAPLFQYMAQQAGVVLVATDWIGLSSGDLDLIIKEVVPDISRIRIITDRLAQHRADRAGTQRPPVPRFSRSHPRATPARPRPIVLLRRQPGRHPGHQPDRSGRRDQPLIPGGARSGLGQYDAALCSLRRDRHPDGSALPRSPHPARVHQRLAVLVRRQRPGQPGSADPRARDADRARPRSDRGLRGPQPGHRDPGSDRRCQPLGDRHRPNLRRRHRQRTAERRRGPDPDPAAG